MTDASRAPEPLKPCPCCQSSEVGAWHDKANPEEECASGLFWVVQCRKCDTRSGEYCTKAQAVEAWNRRSATPASPAREDAEASEAALAAAKEAYHRTLAFWAPEMMDSPGHIAKMIENIVQAAYDVDLSLSHGWIESGQAGELDTSTAAASDATVASAQPSVVSASPAPSLEACPRCGLAGHWQHDTGKASCVKCGYDPAPVEAREPLSDARCDAMATKPDFIRALLWVWKASRAGWTDETQEAERALIRAVASALRGEG